jgi:hypothetical protein
MERDRVFPYDPPQLCSLCHTYSRTEGSADLFSVHYCSRIFFDGMRKNTEHCQSSRSLGQHLNPELTQYEVKPIHRHFSTMELRILTCLPRDV